LKFRVIEREGSGMGVASSVEAMHLGVLLAGWSPRLRLETPSFGETRGGCAVGGGKSRGSAILSHFLHKIADRSYKIKGTKRTAVPCQGNSKTYVLNWQGEDGACGQVGPFGVTGILRAEGVFLDCRLTFSGMIL
jgi:hypothetical protein